MFQFPQHSGSLTLEHNDHLSSYKTVEQEIADCRFANYDDENWVSLEEKSKAIQANELWSFLWHGAERSSFRQLNAAGMKELLEKVGAVYAPTIFPEHKASLTLRHNAHLCNSETVAEELESDPNYYTDDDWVNAEEKAKALQTNELWTLHWYPNSPVGFCLLHASSLDALLNHVRCSRTEG